MPCVFYFVCLFLQCNIYGKITAEENRVVAINSSDDDSVKMPLLAGLLSHAQEGYLSCHTPGHKQGVGSLAEWRQLLGEMVFRLDLTELPGLDNLHDAEGIIGGAQRAAADYFGAKETFFLVNGTRKKVSFAPK